ncbi:MAG: flagellar basal body rod protein FlgC [Bacillota bacterium]|uniref:Flagellar basal-body rod protein FlgC n=1 Tax=Virgibacillus salarius TaxID=447199 RepID=A0A941DQ36_9BACI|nr:MULTISPECIES: flagellar basal body rod protein FlgC [Bacillaceae]NAZ07594.1 flagellar basal body rod protein FlgC [Agaribacter marinus]MBR7794874.1 flagellar basal body rod protein FlgC [Virgibacillus salarius]MCC2249287.1 flagellar basal body rod protein FlgC [Virgibacillus sp. AGTR]MDY7043887.1 flagellar basal body rod protein FlgC [Virgibacillus sp. M23]QRZ17322.1 flagellar basal body rod protein FlgC [Virgibacillus sp. AGTR]
MSIFNALHSSASALTAQRLRMDVISSNIANAQTTRATVNEEGEFEAYRRKMVSLEPETNSFKSFLHRATGSEATAGVKVTEITEDESPFKQVYNPTHPDANENGYVELPNVDPLKEMVDLMSATRSYEANITSVNASKSMLMKALEIGK